MGQIPGKIKIYKCGVVKRNKFADNDLRSVKVLFRIKIPQKRKARKNLIKGLLPIGLTIIVQSYEYIIWVSYDKVDKVNTFLNMLNITF